MSAVAGLAERLTSDLWPEIFVQVGVDPAPGASDLPTIRVDARLDFVEGEHLPGDWHAARVAAFGDLDDSVFLLPAVRVQRNLAILDVDRLPVRRLDLRSVFDLPGLGLYSIRLNGSSRFVLSASICLSSSSVTLIHSIPDAHLWKMRQ